MTAGTNLTTIKNALTELFEKMPVWVQESKDMLNDLEKRYNVEKLEWESDLGFWFKRKGRWFRSWEEGIDDFEGEDHNKESKEFALEYWYALIHVHQSIENLMQNYGLENHGLDPDEHDRFDMRFISDNFRIRLPVYTRGFQDVLIDLIDKNSWDPDHYAMDKINHMIFKKEGELIHLKYMKHQLEGEAL
jgi:hypothetical protein